MANDSPDNPFAGLADPDNPTPEENPFSDLEPQGEGMSDIVAPPVSAGGAFRRGAQRSIVPAATGLAGMGAGAEAGAAVGLLGGPLAEFTVPAGAIIGGIAGMFGGSWAGEKAQSYALKSAPDSWVDALGMDDRQQRLDESQHPIASFLGGLTPYAVTMRPGRVALAKLPENATALQRILANPVTARVFGGAAMGGMELGQEAAQGQIDWRKVAISTGFGVVFNKPTRIGETLTEAGAGPVRAATARFRPTVAQAADAQVVGPGATEEVFLGSHQQDITAQQVAQDLARTEKAVTGEPEAPDLHAVARRLEPELFEQYDRLSAQRDEFRQWIDQASNPTDEALDTAKTQADYWAGRVEKGVAGPQGRRERALAAEADKDYQALLARRQAWLEGRAEQTPEMTQARQHMMAVDEQMRDLSEQVSAAYRRAQEVSARGEVVPEQDIVRRETIAQPTETPEETPPAVPEAEPAAPPVAPTAPPQTIAEDVYRQLTAAGRPEAEARAAAELVAARYATRAARFKGALGTPEELYAREGAEIRGQAPAPEAAPAGPYAAWKPGDEVSVGPIAGLKVVDREGNSFILQRGERSYRFTPPEKAPRPNKQGTELLTHLEALTPEQTKEFAQSKTFEQSRMGRIRLAEGRRPIITLMRDADASTFIHESGHDFFEQLMRDAENEQAPPDVKDDAQTLYDYLKVNGREEVKTRHHEKIARAFEQYLREGVAPSEGLAKVFNDFKQWLIKIYQTIKGLGAPINEDIRGVFDRMLAEEPKRTVYAPEREPQPTLADIHAADARETDPAEAAPAMDRVVAETTQAEAAPPPEVAHEITEAVGKAEATAQPRGETGAGAAEARPVAEGGERSGAQPAGGGVGPGNKPVVGRGGEAGGEGRSVPGPRADNEPPFAPRPAEHFGASESPYLDKAGNIRLDTLTDLESAREAMKAMAEANNDFIGERGGVVTDGQIMDLAKTAGLEGLENTIRRRLAENGIERAVETTQLRLGLIQAEQAYSVASKAAAMRGSSDESVIEFAKAKDRFRLLQGLVSREAAQAGRTLRAFRDIRVEAGTSNEQIMREATGRTLWQMRMEARMAARLDSPEKAAKFITDSSKHSFGRMIVEYFINNLISGPITHATYIVGGEALAIHQAVPETLVASAIGKLRAMGGREGERVFAGESLAQLRGRYGAIAPALKAAGQAVRTGVTTLLPGETVRPEITFQPGAELAESARLDEQYRLAQVHADLFGMLRGAKDAFISIPDLIEAGKQEGAPAWSLEYSPLGHIPNIQYRGVNVAPIGGILRGPGRMVAAAHSFQRAMGFSAFKNAEAWRIASAEGLTGEAFNARVAELRQSPTEEMMEKAEAGAMLTPTQQLQTEITKRAREGATDITLMGTGGELTRLISRLTNWSPNLPLLGETPIFKFVDPFVHISSTIINKALLERSPLGAVFSSEIRADLLGKNGNVAQDMAQAKMLVGSVLSIAVAGLAAEGLVTGSGPADPRKRAVWRAAGYQPHSVRIGDIFYDTHRLGVLGMQIGVAADLYDVAHEAAQGEILKAGAALLHAISQNILDESWMRGPSDLLKAVEDSARYGDSYIRNLAPNFLPYGVGMGQIARAIDPYTRYARTVTDALRSRIPGMSQELYPRIDIWGMPLPNSQMLVGVTAIYESRLSTDPVNVELNRLGMGIAPVPRMIRNVNLTDQQYDMFAQYAGRMTKQRLDLIVNSPDWRVWPEHIQRSVVQETVRQSREVARGYMMAKFPDIIQQATETKLKKVRGE